MVPPQNVTFKRFSWALLWKNMKIYKLMLCRKRTSITEVVLGIQPILCSPATTELVSMLRISQAFAVH